MEPDASQDWYIGVITRVLASKSCQIEFPRDQGSSTQKLLVREYGISWWFFSKRPEIEGVCTSGG